MANSHKKSYTLNYIIIVILIAATAILLGFMLSSFHVNTTMTYEYNRNVLSNPLMGYAPDAENPDECSETNLVFIRLRWSDWESEPGNYNTELIENMYHINEYRMAGKHAVLRFVCDIPDESGDAGSHMDIPEWLYNKTGDGEFYSGEFGTGYSPNYENTYFIERHTLAVKALAEYFNKNDFLAFVQLGSVGHWGEWHTYNGSDYAECSMPSSDTLWQYVLAYTDSFVNAKILMRRSYVYAVEGELGLYNDVVGNNQETDIWLEWAEKGGAQQTTADEIEILPYPEFWNKAPVGGELTSSFDMDILYNDMLMDILDQLSDSHMTFLGPQIPSKSEYSAAYEAIKYKLGYRIYVSQLTSVYSYSDHMIKLNLVWENAGYAPFYYDWPVVVKIFDTDNNIVYWETTSLKLSELLPGEQIITTTLIPFTDIISKGMSVGIMITCFEEDEFIIPAMTLNEYEYIDNALIIYSYDNE